MDMALYRHAIEQLARLREELDGRPPGNAYSPARSATAHRLVELGKNVAEAANGSKAAVVLSEKAERYEAQTGPGTRFEQLRRDALAALAQARGGHSYLMYDETSGVLEELFPYTPRVDLPPTAGRPNALPGCRSLQICSHLGFTNDCCPRPTIDELEARWATVTADLEDSLTARRQLPLLICGLAEIAACLPGRSRLDFVVEQLFDWLCDANARNERGSYLIWQCQHGYEDPEDVEREDYLTVLGHLLPGVVGEMLLAAESLAPYLAAAQESPSDLLEGSQTTTPGSVSETSGPYHPYDEEPPADKRHKYHPTTVACTIPCFVAAIVEVGLDTRMTARRLESMNRNETYWVRRGRGHEAIIHLPMTTHVASKIEELVACVGRLQTEQRAKKVETNQRIAQTRQKGSPRSKPDQN